MDFPPIPIFGAIQRVYALFVFYGGLIFRLMWLPFVTLIILSVGVDLVVMAAFSGNDAVDSVPAILVTLGGEVVAELVIMNFLALRIFRLLLLEHGDERSVFDGTPLVLLPRYMAMFASIGIVVLVCSAGGWMLANAGAPWLGQWALLSFVPTVGAAFLFYCWLSFVLPAASIPVTYRFQESSIATRGALMPIAIVTLFSVLPWFALSLFTPHLLGTAQGPQSWIYWLMLPLTAGLHCIRTVFFVLANAVCFEERTGWHPGAEKVDL